LPRVRIDQGPFRFTEIHGPHRTSDQRFHVGRLLRDRGINPARCEFALGKIPVIELIESLLLEAHDKGQGGNTFEYEAWRAEGAPEAPLRAEFAASYEAARERRPDQTAQVDILAALYANGEDVEPLVAVPSDRVLSSGEQALNLIDGRHRTFAAAQIGVEDLPVFVLVRADAVFAY
jgi:hypothetical protein